MNAIDDLVNQFANIPTDRQINLTTPAQVVNMALPQISVRDYLDLIPAFDGQPSKLSTFIDACENVLPLMAPNNEPTRISFTMLHIRNKLVGKAATLLAARNFATFPELKNLLVSLFGDQRNEEALLSDLNTLRQSKETALQFADRCIDIRCLLLSKLSCQEATEEVRTMKIDLYNNFTLRAFLTGVNPQLSHLLRCRKPGSIEEAIQIVTEEENLNYHRSKINHTPQNNEPQNHKSNTHQLRINPPQIRAIPNNQQYQHQQFKNFQRPSNAYKPMWPHPQTNWPARPNQGHFQSQPGPSQPRSQQNVFLPKNKPVTNTPTPMDVDSRRTRLSNQTQQPSRYPQQQNWRSEQLHIQQSEEVEHFTPENNCSENPGYSESDEFIYDDYQEYDINDQENVNFPMRASETTDRQN